MTDGYPDQLLRDRSLDSTTKYRFHQESFGADTSTYFGEYQLLPCRSDLLQILPMSPAQEGECGTAKVEVQATLTFQLPTTGNVKLRSEVPHPYPASPAPVENQAAATTPTRTAQRRYPQRERRAPQRLNLNF